MVPHRPSPHIRERLDEQRRLLLGDVRAAPRPRAATA